MNPYLLVNAFPVWEPSTPVTEFVKLLGIGHGHTICLPLGQDSDEGFCNIDRVVDPMSLRNFDYRFRIKYKGDN
jgi:hypothetical protein